METKGSEDESNQRLSEDESSKESNRDEKSTVSNEEDSSSVSSSDDSDNSSCSDSDASSEQQGPKDGLSDYERLRLERIKRNQQRLASLGLQEAVSTMALPKRKKRKTSLPSMGPTRTQRSRSSKKKDIVYTAQPRTSSRDRKHERKKEERVPRFIYDELQRIRSKRKAGLKTAKKHSNKAEREWKHWTKSLQKLLNQQQKHRTLLERETQRLEKQAKAEERDAAERKELDCQNLTKLELFKEIEKKTPQLVAILSGYDTKRADDLRRSSEEEEAQHQRALERKRLVMEGLDVFPKAYNDALKKLNFVLYERTPKDKSRRSIRRSFDAAFLETPLGPTKGPSCNGPPFHKKAKHFTPKLEASARPRSGPSKGRKRRLPLHRPPPNNTSETTPMEPSGMWKKLPEPQLGKKKIKDARFVGGWISPKFSQELDRKWLERTRPFDPKDSVDFLGSYVPQAKDIVLYYPSSHKDVMSLYPDTLGSRQRNLLRVPLWARANRERNRIARGETKIKVWWKDEWIDSLLTPSKQKSYDNDDRKKRVENDRLLSHMGDYPILCRVERTHVEFPEDPYANQDPKSTTQASKKANKPMAEDSDGKGSKIRPPIRLAVTLKALSSVVPPENGLLSSKIDLPPNFTVVTFPVQAPLEQFIVPFCWAYTSSHSFAIGETIWIQRATNNDTRDAKQAGLGGKGRIVDFVSRGDLLSTPTFEPTVSSKEVFDGISLGRKGMVDGGGGGRIRLDDNWEELETLLALVTKDGMVNPEAVESLLNSDKRYSPSLPLEEAMKIVDFFLLYNKSRNPNTQSSFSQPSSPMPSLMTFILRTLPRHRGAIVSLDSDPRALHRSSPWNLVTLQPTELSERLKEDVSRRTTTRVLDPKLREKAIIGLKDIIRKNPYASWFLPLVTERMAPAYYCVVPLGMSLDRILARLKVQGNPVGSCYYTSIDSVGMDLQLIYENCLLYNSPQSELVAHCGSLVSQCQQWMKKLSQHASWSANDAGVASESLSDAKKQSSVEAYSNAPYKGKIHWEWLQQYQLRSFSNGETMTRKGSSWFPQAGEQVLYSRSNHSKFINGHFDSLEKCHCVVANVPSSSSVKESPNQSEYAVLESIDWEEGRVASVRVVFPKERNRTADSFAVTTPLLIVKLRFHQTTESQTICWRPCILSALDSETCKACGLSGASFLRPTKAPCSWKTSEKESLKADRCTSIGLCLDLLKQRCLDGIPPEFVNVDLALENAAFGVGCMLDSHNLPCYQDFFAPSKYGKKGTKKGDYWKRVKILSRVGYMPLWTLEDSQDITERKPKHALWMPFPTLCLELVRLRLLHGYYQSLEAIANDIVESYVESVLFLLSETRSKVSIRKLAKHLMSSKESGKISRISIKKKAKKPKEEGHQHQNPLPVATTGKPKKGKDSTAVAAEKFSDEEEAFMERIVQIRKFHAAAMAFAVESEHVERICCLKSMVEPTKEPIVEPDTAMDPTMTPLQQEGISKIRRLLQATGREYYRNRFKFTDRKSYKFRIKVGDHYITENGQLQRTDEQIRFAPDHALAALPNRSEMKLYIRCGSEKILGETKIVSDEFSSDDPCNLYYDASAIGQEDVIFGMLEFKNDENLAKSLFGRPNRMYPCVRCQCNGGSMLSCRVLKCHAVPDYDLVGTFKGTNGVDSLLSPWKETKGDDNPRAESTDNDLSSGGDANDNEIEATRATAEAETKELLNALAQQISIAKESHSKAATAYSLATYLRAQAIRMSKMDVKLSEAFISANFPYDSEDNHYAFCIHCGCPGDLLICDGCPNVSHAQCAGLSAVPEGDWFCQKCQSKTAVEPKEDTKPNTNTVLAQNVIENHRTKEASMDHSNNGAVQTADIAVAASKSASNENPKLDDDSIPNDIDPKKENISPTTKEALPNIGDDEFDQKQSELDAILNNLLNSRMPPKQAVKKKSTTEPSLDPIEDSSDPINAISQPWVREFLSFLSIESAKDLLETKSGPIAIDLTMWRKEKGMKPLARNGNLSIVSSWKRIVRKAAAGDLELQKIPDTTEEISNVFQKLPSQGQKFCSSIGITKAEVFLETPTKELAKKYASWRKKQNMSPLQGSGNSAYIGMWKAIVRKASASNNKDKESDALDVQLDVHVPDGYKVRKLFDDGIYYEGNVVSGPTQVLDEESGELVICWRVKYLDDDEEEFTLEELETWGVNTKVIKRLKRNNAKDERKAESPVQKSNQEKSEIASSSQEATREEDKITEKTSSGNGIICHDETFASTRIAAEKTLESSESSSSNSSNETRPERIESSSNQRKHISDVSKQMRTPGDEKQHELFEKPNQSQGDSGSRLEKSNATSTQDTAKSKRRNHEQTAIPLQVNTSLRRSTRGRLPSKVEGCENANGILVDDRGLRRSSRQSLK